jgi:hypothetical protein
MRVISAAKEGRYYHGNGAQWFVEEDGKKIAIDTMYATEKEVPEYQGTAHASYTTASNLERFLRVSDPELSHLASHTGQSLYLFVDELVEAAADKRVLFSNGGYYVYLNNYNRVVWFMHASGPRGSVDIVTMSELASWKYMQSHGNERVSENTRQFILENDGLKIRAMVNGVNC